MARPRKRDETELSKFLDDALRRRGLSNTEFCQKVGLKPATLSDLKLRKETVVPDRASAHRWAAVLELDATGEQRLFELLQLAHSPVYVQELVQRLRQDNQRMAAELAVEYRTT